VNSGGIRGNGRTVDAAHSSRTSQPEAESFPFGLEPAVLRAAPSIAVAPSSREVSWESAHLLAWAGAVVMSAAVTAMYERPVADDPRTRLFRHFYGGGQLLAAGVLIGGATLVFRRRISRSPIAALVATLIASFTLGWTVLKNDYLVLANRL